MADMDVIAGLIHGWLIPGGADIDASRWGETNHEKVELQDPARFEGEASLYARLQPDVPILGICYGCQFLNVARGGSLIQHVPDVVGHESHSGGTLQSYRLEADSKLATAMATGKVEGKSYHHQAVGNLGEGLRVVAHAADGIVEAVEALDRPFVLGVQWHPERTAEDAATRRLFESFIAAARLRL
jgi:putative glutamine amidotransferase